MNKPVMSSFQTASMTGLLIKDDRSEFENLPAVNWFSRDLPNDLDIRKAATRDAAPLPQTKDREFYHGDAHAAWWLSGFQDMRSIEAAAVKHGTFAFEDCRYFELGCASGRVVRHMAHQTNAEVWCSDINLRHTEWVRKYLPSNIRTFNNAAFPYLPLESNYFDIVSAFSVFTHIDDLELMWMAELARVLAPGGIAYLTVQTENTWEQYRNQWIRDNLEPMAGAIPDFAINAELFEGPLPQEKTVFWWQTREIYNSTVFHTIKYIEREWGRFLKVKEIIPNGSTYQDVVILRKE